MNIQGNQNIGELVAKDYRTASVFKKYGVDFCCQGNRTIDAACQAKKIDSQLLVDDLNALNQSGPDQGTDYQSWPLDLLADYIEKKHHRFVKEKTQEIIPFLHKVCRVHGDRHPELLEINEEFLASAEELGAHMQKEELILFPYVRKIAEAKQGNSKLEAPAFGTVQNPINMMMEEHTIEGERFRKIEALTNNYTPPIDACTTYRVTFALLRDFEQDLHLHIHLENNILFPKAIELEQKLS